IAISFLPVIWISFCYHIRMGYSLFKRKIYLLLLTYPVSILFLIYTNTFHHLLGNAPQYRLGNYEITRELNSLSTLMLLTTFFVIFLGIAMLVIKPNEALKKGGKSRWIIVFMGLLTIGTAFLEWRNKYSHHFEITPLTVSLVGLSALLYLKNSIRSQVLLNRYNILSTLKEPLFLMKEDGLVLFANNSAVKLSGIKEIQFYSVNIKSVIPPLQNLKDGVIFHNSLFFSVNVNPVLREKDRIYAVSLTEITALKDSEISLKNLTYELENQVKNRTDRLNLTNQKLEKLLEEKNILLQEVHHRVNNNLQLIISLLNLQSNRVEEEHIKEYLKDAVTRVQTIAMVHQMLYKSEDFSRINLKLYLDVFIAFHVKGAPGRPPARFLRYHLFDNDLHSGRHDPE
ncbi:MAG: hypothetical protein PF518_19275, partial [Spirochaetaceae bacterium]|nr:hypothetical protein [Spirochaetaceae bacterium]